MDRRREYSTATAETRPIDGRSGVEHGQAARAVRRDGWNMDRQREHSTATAETRQIDGQSGVEHGTGGEKHGQVA